MHPPRLDSLTSLRAVAALVVCFHHSALTEGTAELVGQGRAGVSFFFVLSGFVLMWSRRPSRGAREFWRDRFARIYPSYLVAWVAAGALVLIAGLGETNWAHFASGAVLLQSWVPHPDWYFTTNGVSWSLSTEVFFYLTFPFWAGSLAAASPSRRRAVAAVSLVAVVVIAIVADRAVGDVDLVATPDSVWVWLVRTAPPVRLLEFVLGAWLALEVRDRALPRVGLVPAALLTAVAYVVAGQWRSLESSVAVTLVPFLLLVLAAAQSDLMGRASVLRHPWFVWAGVVSYAFYLVHEMVVKVLRDGAGMPIGALVPTTIVMSLFLGSLLHRLVEAPAERRLRGRNSAVVSGD